VAYSVIIKPPAEKALRRLDQETQGRILNALESLARDPYPPGCKKLAEFELYRIRVGAYRVVYFVEGKLLRVLVVKVGHRREVYRNL
jgi:mRNA interferase RelE/StbE